jgi:hypothetical protein
MPGAVGTAKVPRARFEHEYMHILTEMTTYGHI